jgi:hypothetical protein
LESHYEKEEKHIYNYLSEYVVAAFEMKCKYYNRKWDSSKAFGSFNKFFKINEYVIDVRNLSPFFSFLALPPFPQQRAFVDNYCRKGVRQPLF